MSQSRRKRNLVNLALVAFSLGISLFLAELMLRQAFPIDTGTSYQHRVPHPVLGWILEPGASYLNRMPEATTRVSYNAKGWRDIDHSFERSSGAFRILVLGDSFMEGYSVDINESFHKRIEHFIRKYGIDVEVINLGVGGYGTLQEYLVFREFGKLYKPDLVLLGFYAGNDVRNNSIALESMMNADLMKIETRPFLDLTSNSDWNITVVDYKGAQGRYISAKERQNSFPRSLAKRSALLQRLIKAKSAMESGMPDTEKSRKSRADQEQSYLALHGSNYCAEQPEYTNAWSITKRILKRLNQDTSTIGSQLLVFSVPSLHETNVFEMEKIVEYAPNPAALCLEDAPAYERLQKILTELEIEYVDLLPEFRNVELNSKTSLFRRSDRHWNSEGHALAAKIVGTNLVERQLLKAGNAVEQNTRVTLPVNRHR